MFCYTHFLGGLPDEYGLFKKKVKSEFHKVFDTKYIYITLQSKRNNNNTDTVSLPPDKAFHLEDLFKYFYNKYKDKVNITIPSTIEINNHNTVHYDNYLSSIDNGKFHNADYDSFVTGCAYVYMLEEFSHELVDDNAFKFNLIGSIYNCMNLNENDDVFAVENTNAYIIKQKVLSDTNDLDNVISNTMNNVIQKVYFYEKDKSIIAFVNKECNFINEINQCSNMLEALTLDEYKERNKKDKKERKKNNFKQKSSKYFQPVFIASNINSFSKSDLLDDLI